MAAKQQKGDAPKPAGIAQSQEKRSRRPELISGGGPAGSADNLDNLIHERTRLAIISTLAVHERLSFSELKALLQMSDGNLSVQARKLEEAGYLHCDKHFAGRTPRTDYSLTTAGREALQRYVAHMEAIIQSVKRDT